MKSCIICLSVILLFSFKYNTDSKAQSADTGNQKLKEPLDYVNPNIGGIGHLLVATDPVVHLPDGAVRLSSNPWPEIYDRYLADKVFSFSLRDVVRYGTETIPSWIMASTGNIKVTPAEMASNYDHDFETVTPYYSSLLLEDYDINVEYTATQNVSYFRFTFPKAADSHILMGSNAKFTIVDNNTLEGQESAGNSIFYFYAKFSKPFTSFGTWNDDKVFQQSNTQNGKNIGVFTNYTTSGGDQIEVKAGVSNESIEQARKNLEKEIHGWNFDEIKNAAKNKWKESLAKVKIEGGTESQLTIFYTGLYFAGGGERVLDAMKLRDERAAETAQRYANLPKNKLYPPVSSPGGMFQHWNIIFITDIYLRGIRNFDIEKAYENMKAEFMESTKLPWRKGPATELDSFYLKNGYFPALPPGIKEWVPAVHNFERRQCVTVTLNAAYESWCIAQIAKALNKNADYEYFIKHAHDYQNVFNSQTGFMSPKTADGKWIEPFNQNLSGGQGGREYFSELNSWMWTWYVPHDIGGLVNLLGGREKFVAKLDALFQEQYQIPKYHFLSQFPDQTGLIGNYAHGNEMVRIIPYLYNYAGSPWKTQKRVREIMDVWYGPGPLGICGDEDGGMMSLWYIYSAMGIYSDPYIPGYPVWQIGSPVVEKSTINLGNNKTFTIEAKNVSAQNKYVQSATLNGKPLDKPWFDHSDLLKGGTLILIMGPRPDKQWGTKPQAAPPSMTVSGGI
ncbi:MAG: glycoside hydrolase family 92 protein [Bacteroidia bacterium]|nr:glycoside hydrolase family 92 protein [Bacteroidia bacterium]